MSSDRFITHLTSAGERWDLLAWRYYSDPAAYGPIVMANPAIRIAPAFDAGWTIVIPVLTVAPPQSTDLPPWKRSR